MIKINEMNPGKETVGFEAIIISVTVGKTNGVKQVFLFKYCLTGCNRDY